MKQHCFFKKYSIISKFVSRGWFICTMQYTTLSDHYAHGLNQILQKRGSHDIVTAMVTLIDHSYTFTVYDI